MSEMNERNITYIVIPAFEPDHKMVELLKLIKEQTTFNTIVVDDGSGDKYAGIFDEAENYATVIYHQVNVGKGDALKTAYEHIYEYEQEPCYIVTADADGQHTIKDINGVREILVNHEDDLVLGSRKFTGNVPAKSKIGNAVTRKVFKMSTGMTVFDTQTGLRAFHSKYLKEMMEISGNRYEYEINVLLKWAEEGKSFFEHTIQTVYLDNNKSSHFHPFRDSFQIYREILKFSCSSFISFIADYLIYSLLIVLTGAFQTAVSVTISNITARIISAGINYHLNRKYVFNSKANIGKTALQYGILAILILVMNTILLNGLVETIVPNRYVAKIIVELTLFVFSCTVQKRFIFRKQSNKETRYGKAISKKTQISMGHYI